MGIRSPQNTPTVKLRQEGTTRFSGTVAPQINTTALGTLSKDLQAKDTVQTEFIKNTTENKLEEARLQGQAALSEHEGISSLDASRKINEKYKASVVKILDGVPEHLRPYVENSVVKSGVRFNSFVTPYVHQQVKKVEKEAYDTKISNDANAAVENSGDMEAFTKEGLPSLAESIAARARKMYGDDPNVMTKSGLTTGELVGAEVKKGISSTIYSGIEVQARAGNVEHAKGMYDALKGNLETSDLIKSEKLFNKLKQNDLVRAPIDKAVLILKEVDNDYSLAAKMAEGMASDSKEFGQIMAVVKNRISMQKQTDQISDRNAIASMTERLVKNKQLPSPEELNQIKDYKERTAFISAIDANDGTLGKITNPEIYDMLIEKLSTANPDQAKDMNLPSYRAFLSSSDYRTLEKLNTDLFKKDSSGKLAASQSDVGEILKEVGVFAKGKKLNRSQGRELNKLAMEEYNRVRDGNPQYNTAQIKASVLNRLYDRSLEEKEEFNWFSPNTMRVSGVAKSVDPLKGLKVNASWRSMLSGKYPSATEAQIDEMLVNINKKLGPEALAKPVSFK